MITHPDKVLFPDDGITKGELAAYYEAAAPLMLPHLQGRPVTMERYPSGTSRSMGQRLAAVGDLWSDLLTSGQSLREPVERLRQL